MQTYLQEEMSSNYKDADGYLYTQCVRNINTGLFEMVAWVLTTCHTQYTWDRSICIFLFNRTTQHVSDVNTAILRSLRLICWVISWVVLLWFDVCWCYVAVWLWWCGIRMQSFSLHTSNQINTTHEITQQISHKLLRMDVLASETCWTLSNEIINKVTSSSSLFIQRWWLYLTKFVLYYVHVLFDALMYWLKHIIFDGSGLERYTDCVGTINVMVKTEFIT